MSDKKQEKEKLLKNLLSEVLEEKIKELGLNKTPEVKADEAVPNDDEEMAQLRNKVTENKKSLEKWMLIDELINMKIQMNKIQENYSKFSNVIDAGLGIAKPNEIIQKSEAEKQLEEEGEKSLEEIGVIDEKIVK